MSTTPQNTAHLSLGSNEGNRLQYLQTALTMLRESSNITAISSIYETAAWGITDQPAFLNMAVAIETAQSPEQLLQTIRSIEAALGRQRHIKWGPRTLDIDILFYNYLVIDTPELIIPHPFLQERHFVLAPLNEIAPNYIHPLLNKTVAQLLNACNDPLEVHLTIKNNNS